MNFLLMVSSPAYRDFLEQISRSFRSSPFEILMFIILVGLFLLFLIAGSIVRTRMTFKRNEERSEEITERVCRKLGMSEGERKMITSLSKTISGGKRKKYLIVTDPLVFNTAAHRYLKKDKSGNAFITSLRIRLGFTSFDEGKSIHSSADLKVSCPVYIVCRIPRTYTGHVTKQGVFGLGIWIENEKDNGPRAGDILRVYFSKENGIYYFDTKVLENMQNTIILKHTEDVKKIQRRKYYRARMQKKIGIKKAGTNGEFIPALLIDLGGDGAMVGNPGHIFKENDRLLVLIKLQNDQKHTINTKAVKTSHNNAYIHLQFLNMRENQRDDIIKYLFKQYNQKNHHPQSVKLAV